MLVISIWLFWSFLILHLAKLGFIKSDRNYSNGELKVFYLWLDLSADRILSIFLV